MNTRSTNLLHFFPVIRRLTPVSLIKHIEALDTACAGEPDGVRSLHRHRCEECDEHGDEYVVRTVKRVAAGEQPAVSTKCPITLARTCAALCVLYEQHVQPDEQPRALIVAFDELLPGALALEREFMAEDGLLTIPYRRKWQPRRRLSLAAGLAAFLCVGGVSAAILADKCQEVPQKLDSAWAPFETFPSSIVASATELERPPVTEVQSPVKKPNKPAPTSRDSEPGGCRVTRTFDWAGQIDPHAFVSVDPKCFANGHIDDIDVACTGADCGVLGTVRPVEARHGTPGIYPADSNTIGVSMGSDLRPTTAVIELPAACCPREAKRDDR
jgi:hypothetical protein